MVSARPKPESKGSSSLSKQSKRIGKRVMYEGVHYQPVAFTKEWLSARERMKEALSLYRELLSEKKLLAQLSQEHEQKPRARKPTGILVHINAAKVLERAGKWINTAKQVGHVLGVKVGDEFHWRGELNIVGLHQDFQKGIDYMKLMNDKIVATSIVDSGRYDNLNTPDTLTYCGEGENPNFDVGRKPKDQKLTAGNLALKNSMTLHMPVRVIRRINFSDGSKQFSNSMASAVSANDCGYKFVYDGLYRVTKYWIENGKLGANVYKFLLKRDDD